MKVLGRIGGNETVLDKTDGFNALTLVSEFPDPSGTVRSIQLEVAIDDYKAGDIFKSDGSTWSKVEPPPEGVKAVSGLVYPRLGRDVQIRWTDPLDNINYVWKHTRLLRKYGNYPSSPLDGTIVVDSYSRDYYKTVVLHDVLPVGTEDGWKYRFYTFSEDEVAFTNDACAFSPIDLTWENLPNIVRNGQAQLVYELGDMVTINLTNNLMLDGDNKPTVISMNFEVAGFDCVEPKDLTLTHSITFVSVNAFPYKLRMDDKWSRYQLTTDQYVTSSTKKYYTKLVDGRFVAATGLKVGQRLTPNTYYELSDNEERQQNGGNRWAASAFRKWYNSEDQSDIQWDCNLHGNSDAYPDENKRYFLEHKNKTITEIDLATIAPGTSWDDYRRVIQNEEGGQVRIHVLDTKFPPILTMFPQEIFNVISEVRNITARPTYDGAGADISIDKLCVPSRTEVFGDTEPNIYYELTSDRTPKEVYVLTTDTERDMDKTYFLFRGSSYYIAGDGSFNEDGSFIEGENYYELVTKTYYLRDGADFRPTTPDDFTESHDFKRGVDYHDQVVDAPDENKHLPQFDDKVLLPKIKHAGDESATAVTWWLRSASRTTSSVMNIVDTEGNLVVDGDNSYTEFKLDSKNRVDNSHFHYPVVEFTVA